MASLQQENQWPCMYGYPAYLLRVHLQVPYRGAGIAPQIELYNKESNNLLYNVRF